MVDEDENEVTGKRIAVPKDAVQRITPTTGVEEKKVEVQETVETSNNKQEVIKEVEVLETRGLASQAEVEALETRALTSVGTDRVEEQKTIAPRSFKQEEVSPPVEDLTELKTQALPLNVGTDRVEEQKTREMRNLKREEVSSPVEDLTELETRALPLNVGMDRVEEQKTREMRSLKREEVRPSAKDQAVVISPVKLGAVQTRIVDTATINLSAIGIQPASRRLEVMDIVLFLLPLGALVLWFLSLSPIALNQMNDLGLVSALSPGVMVALGIIVVSFAFTLQRKELRVPLLALQLLCLIIIIYGTPNLVEQMPRFTVVYRHAGYTEYITRTGSVNPYLDIYFNWPGFFILAAFFTKVFGYSTILSYAGWAPIFFNLIYCAPMYMIFSSMTSNKRLIWLSLLFFHLTNWVGQDYFSPQALNFFLYLVVIAILLKWFRVAPKKQVQLGKDASIVQKFFAWFRAPDPQGPVLGKWQRRGMICCLLLVYGLIVFSHPLTPFFTLASVFLLVLFRRCYSFWLFIIMTLMTAAWILIMAQPYLSQHIGSIVDTLGDLTNNVPKSVTSGDLTESPLYQIIAKMRLYTTAGLWLLAFVGALKRLRQGHRDITYVLLAISGFPLIAAQGYGGEMLMRIYLFTSPFMVFFTASLFSDTRKVVVNAFERVVRPGRSIPWRAIAIALVNLILIGAFLFTRYGDERVDYVSYEEWNAVQYLYQIAPNKSYILEAWDDTPLFFENYEKYKIQSMTAYPPDTIINADVNTVIQIIASQNNSNSYMLFSQEEQEHASVWNGLPTDVIQRLEAALLQTGEFKLVYTNSDAQILQYIGMGS